MQTTNTPYKILQKTLLLLCLSFFLPGSYAHAVGWVGEDFKGIVCNGLSSNFGPFDYTNYDHKQKRLGIVERYHFMPKIRYLRELDGSGKDFLKVTHIYGDIYYTLRAFPNHHNALNTMMKLRLYSKKWPSVPMECFFKRAIATNKKDGISHLLFAIYLHRLKMHQEAEVEYKKAEKLTHSLELYYNYGLFLANLKRYKEAVPYAEKAYNRGYPFSGLKDKLKQAGYPLKLKQRKSNSKPKQTK